MPSTPNPDRLSWFERVLVALVILCAIAAVALILIDHYFPAPVLF